MFVSPWQRTACFLSLVTITYEMSRFLAHILLTLSEKPKDYTENLYNGLLNYPNNLHLTWHLIKHINKKNPQSIWLCLVEYKKCNIIDHIHTEKYLQIIFFPNSFILFRLSIHSLSEYGELSKFKRKP